MKNNSDNSIEIADPFARRLMAQYLERRRADLTDLRKALADGDFAAIAVAGHNMYGSGAAYGLERVSEIGADLERAADTQAADRIGPLLDRLEQVVNEIRVA